MHPVPVLSRVRGAFQKKQIPCRPGGEKQSGQSNLSSRDTLLQS